MATTFPTTAYTNGVTATADMINKAITAGYTPNTALAQNDVMAALLANFLTVLPAIKIFAATPTLTQVNTVSTSEQDITVTGVLATDVCLRASGPSTLNAGVGIVDYRVKAADTITVRFINTTAGNITPGATVMQFVVTAKAS